MENSCARFGAWWWCGYATGCSGALGVLHRVGGRGRGHAPSAAAAEWSGRWAGFAPTWQSRRPLLRVRRVAAAEPDGALGCRRCVRAPPQRLAGGAAFPGGRTAATDDDVRFSHFPPQPAFPIIL